jgi:hypothetical protein
MGGMANVETVTVTIEENGNADELTLPVGVVEMLAEEGDTVPQTVGDIALLGFAQQVHAHVHHSQGEPGEALQAIEEETMAQFEERFGATYAEMTGHDH